VEKGITVKEATIELGFVDGEKLTMEQLDKALAVLPMTRPPQ
jgi:fumarate hydratase class II